MAKHGHSGWKNLKKTALEERIKEGAVHMNTMWRCALCSLRPSPTAALVKQMGGRGVECHEKDHLEWSVLAERKECLVHLSGLDSLSLYGDLDELHVGHGTVSLTFKQHGEQVLSGQGLHSIKISVTDMKPLPLGNTNN